MKTTLRHLLIWPLILLAGIVIYHALSAADFGHAGGRLITYGYYLQSTYLEALPLLWLVLGTWLTTRLGGLDMTLTALGCLLGSLIGRINFDPLLGAGLAIFAGALILLLLWRSLYMRLGQRHRTWPIYLPTTCVLIGLYYLLAWLIGPSTYQPLFFSDPYQIIIHEPLWMLSPLLFLIVAGPLGYLGQKIKWLPTTATAWPTSSIQKGSVLCLPLLLVLMAAWSHTAQQGQTTPMMFFGHEWFIVLVFIILSLSDQRQPFHLNPTHRLPMSWPPPTLILIPLTLIIWLDILQRLIAMTIPNDLIASPYHRPAAQLLVSATCLIVYLIQRRRRGH